MLFDAHLDLALNAIEWNRDLRLPLATVREREAHLRDKPGRGRGTVSLPELRRGKVGIVVATQLARVEHNAYSPVFGWASPEQAWSMTQAQLAWYRSMEDCGEMVQIRDRRGLDAHLALWNGKGRGRKPIGYLLSLEGADSLVTLHHLERAFAYGLRAIGPAHYGPGLYANGTDATGRLNRRGRELLREIARLGLILDATHLCDDAFWQALDLFDGPVWASHQNCRALVPHHRQFSDDQLRALIARGAVIGAPLDAWMIVPGWIRGKTTPKKARVTLEHVADHIDHICQLAGNARHMGLGSDLDGAFGNEQTPLDVQSIADLQRIFPILQRRGYSPEDREGIASANFIRFLRQALP
jgi:membrane dipeptidase